MVLEGDPRYHYFSVVLKFVPGTAAGTINAMWTATYIPVGDMGPSEHIKGIAILSVLPSIQSKEGEGAGPS
jgi:hypothetical protein